MDARAYGLERPHYRAVSRRVTFSSDVSPARLSRLWRPDMGRGRGGQTQLVKCCNMN